MATAAKKVETCCGVSSINSLPDEVLGQIMSLVPSKLAASTSVLSKRWRNLLPLGQNLDFDGPPNTNAATSGRGFLDFVDRTLVSMGDYPIKKFSLKWKPYMDDSWYNHLIRNVLGRGTLELHLSSSCLQYMEPEVFFSNTLVKLTLSGGCYAIDRLPPGGVFFPALKSLSLFRVGDIDTRECLLSSPLLEELNLRYDEHLEPGWGNCVWDSSIQRMSIFYRSHDLESRSGVSIKTPDLVYLDYSSYVAEDYVFELDSLVEARLDLVLWKYNEYKYYGYDSTKGDAWGDATKLVAAISNVVTLHLSADSLEVLYCCCRSMPEFNNLVKLSFESHKERDWQVLPLLLRNAPNLETLVIKGLVHKITKGCGDVCVCKRVTKKRKKESCLLSCQVKVLEIYEYGGSCRELKQMRHFMENLRCLEVVKVKVEVDMQDNLSLTNTLKKLFHTASSKCKIQFI